MSFIKQASEGGKYRVELKPFFDGNEYYLFIYQDFNDVRLVGAPPSSIGKFGGDTDNWMWPRHTGDFSMLRVYANENNEPAEYAETNKPYKPKHALPISMSGVQEGDFAMIMGYPGSTDRFLTSYGIKDAINLYNPAVVAVRDAKLKTLKKDMNTSDKTRIMYASKYAQISNYWKYFQGQTRGLQKLNVAARKEAEENRFRQWANENESRKVYRGVVDDIASAYSTTSQYTISKVYLNEAAFGAESMLFGLLASRKISDEAFDEKGILKPDVVTALKTQAEAFFDEVNTDTDQKLFAVTMKMFSENVPQDQQPQVFKEAVKKFKGNFDKMAATYYKKSAFSSYQDLASFLDGKPSKKALRQRPYLQLITGHDY